MQIKKPKNAPKAGSLPQGLCRVSLPRKPLPLLTQIKPGSPETRVPRQPIRLLCWRERTFPGPCFPDRMEASKVCAETGDLVLLFHAC